jgi:hypothetical protein
MNAIFPAIKKAGTKINPAPPATASKNPATKPNG